MLQFDYMHCMYANIELFTGYRSKASTQFILIQICGWNFQMLFMGCAENWVSLNDFEWKGDALFAVRELYLSVIFCGYSMPALLGWNTIS